MKIEVKQIDIERGVRYSSILCPVARAVKRAIKMPLQYRSLQIQYDLELNGKIIVLPQRVRKFVVRFDAGKSVRPFSFELDYPKIEVKSN